MEQGLSQLESILEKIFLKNPGRALQVATQLGMASANAKKNPLALMNAGVANREIREFLVKE